MYLSTLFTLSYVSFTSVDAVFQRGAAVEVVCGPRMLSEPGCLGLAGVAYLLARELFFLYIAHTTSLTRRLTHIFHIFWRS
jgi:hypothetical protein